MNALVGAVHLDSESEGENVAALVHIGWFCDPMSRSNEANTTASGIQKQNQSVASGTARAARPDQGRNPCDEFRYVEQVWTGRLIFKLKSDGVFPTACLRQERHTSTTK